MSWLDWTQAQSDTGRELSRYLARLIALRRAHPSVRGARYGDAGQELVPGVAAISWFDAAGAQLDAPAWESEQERVMGLRRAARREDGGTDVTLLLMNPTHEPVSFALPEPATAWIRELDSATQAPSAPLSDAAVMVEPRSLVLLAAAQAPGDKP
ncbi:Isoamylase precursor [compost metagenome]